MSICINRHTCDVFFSRRACFLILFFSISLLHWATPNYLNGTGEKIVLWVATVPDTDGCEKVCKKKEVEDLNVVKKRKK